jgi:hypothetical protein
VANVTYRDIRLTNTDGEVVQLTMNYNPGLPPTNATATPRLFNVTVENLVSDKSKQGWLIDGLPESALDTIVLRNVSINAVSSSLNVKCDYVRNSMCDGVQPSCPPCF